MSYTQSLPGVGWVSLVPTGTYPDPVHLAEIESLDWSYNEDTADLENAAGDVIDTFTTKRSLEGSVKLKSLPNSLIVASTRGAALTTGQSFGYAVQGSVPGSVSYTIAVTPPNSGTWAQDLGVVNLTTGKPMACDSTATGTGVYSVSAGTYTFNSADASASVLINYRATLTTGTTTTVSAVAASTATSKYALHCYQEATSRRWGLYIPSAHVYGLSAALSKGGWSDVTLKFKATLDSSGNLAYHYRSDG